jgi:putative Mn2+ efflux pump MntP
VASTLLFGIAANADNLTVGISYGMRRRRIGWQHNLLIAVITTLITLVALALGREIREILPPGSPDMLGGALLMAFAAWSFYRERAEASAWTPVPILKSAEGASVGTGESLFLSGTLAINNVGLALAGGIGGVGYVVAGLSIFGLSIVMLASGQAIGSNITRLQVIPQIWRHPTSGNAVLALAGVLMIAGY